MIIEYKGHKPQIAESAFIAPNATVIGQVEIGENSNVWFGAVIRGDSQLIRIGDETNIQDNVTLHSNRDHIMIIGNGVTIGHNAVVHGCVVGDNSLIGMGAVVMDGAVIGKNSIVGAGALVTPGKKFPDGSLIVGSPAYVKSELSEEAAASNRQAAEGYVNRGREFKALLNL